MNTSIVGLSGSQIGAIASRQSEVLASYQELQNRVQQLEEKYSDADPHSSTGILGRLPGYSATNRILAGPAQSFARSLVIYESERRRMASRTIVAVKSDAYL